MSIPILCAEARRRGISLILLQPNLARSLLILLGVLPAAFLLADIHSFAVNVPFMDDWQFVPLLEKAKNGTLTFGQVWAPHDEHRLLLLRFIIIASMFASGGDYRVQSFITFSLGPSHHLRLPALADDTAQREQI